MMSDKMFTVSCDPICGFTVSSHDRKEAGDMGFEHVSNKHKEKGMTKSQVEESIVAE